jgi:enamine deaminase RidA (YjgF/YER057c/UK114 family)
LDKTGLTLIDGIGATEMFHIFISSSADANTTHTLHRPGALGKVVPGYRAKVVDAAGNEVGPGVIGRLAVQGPTGCQYFRDPRQSNYVQGGWNFPGDAFSQDAEGYFYFHARADDMIITGGYNVGGPEVEDCLLLHPAVAECGVVGKPDAERGMIIKAFVVLKTDCQTSVDELQHHVKNALAPYKYPREIEFVAKLPRTETGKLQRFALRQPASAPATPSTPTTSPHPRLEPAGWAKPKGYANGVLAHGKQIYVGGQIGWNAAQVFESDDFIAQTKQALLNIKALLAEAQAGPEHIVRMTWYIIDRTEYLARQKELGAAYREVMSRHYPAMSCVVVAGLIETRAKVEIEVTAVV